MFLLIIAVLLIFTYWAISERKASVMEKKHDREYREGLNLRDRDVPASLILTFYGRRDEATWVRDNETTQ